MAEREIQQRPAVSDGKCLRAIWRPSDGNGDADLTVYEASRYTTTGHPTWKLYCGDAPHNVNGSFVEPPKHVYLDDRSCYRILHFAGYSSAERSRLWRHDFDGKGGIKPHRRNRGRPALSLDGDVCQVKTGPSKSYRFSGAQDLKEVDLIKRELDSQCTGVALTVSAPSSRRRSARASKSKRKACDRLRDIVDTTRPVDITEDNGPNFTDPRGKRLRLVTQSAAATSVNSVSELKATIVALQDRARLTSDTLLDLQKRNSQLDISLKSQQVLYHQASVDLASARALNIELMAQLREKAARSSAGLQKDMEITALRNQASVYRTMAVQLWSKQKVSEGVLEKSAEAAAAIERLTETLVRMKRDLNPLMEAHESVKEDSSALREQMKIMLGDAWDGFDEEAEKTVDLG